MARRRCVAFLVATSALLSSALLAQTGGKILGRVVDREGNPVVGAEVVVHSQDVLYRSDLGPGVTHRIKSGARGRFSFRIDASRTWSAWATWTDANGRPHASTVRERLGDGAVTTLPEDGIEHAKRTLVIRNVDAWRQRGPLRYRVVAPTLFRYWVDLEVPDKDGESAQSEVGVALPPMPGLQPWLEIFDREGYPLHNWPLTNDGKATVTVSIPSPRTIAVKVVDEDTKQPVTDASVLWAAFAWPCYPLQSTSIGRSLRIRDPGMAQPIAVDQDGVARFDVCWSTEPPTNKCHFCDIVAMAPGRARKTIRLNANDGTAECTLEIGPSRTVRCGLRGRDGTPLVGMPCYVSANAARTKTSEMNYAWRRLETDSDGTLAWTASVPASASFVCLAPTNADLAALLPKDAEPLLGLPRAHQLLWVDTQQRKGTTHLDFDDIGFGHWSAHEVIARRSDGAPASRSTLLCERTQGGLGTGFSQDVVLSRDGRGLLVLQPGSYELAILDPETGDFAMQQLDVREDRVPSTQRLTLDLSSPRRIEILALGPDGNPLPRASLEHGLGTLGGRWGVVSRALAYLSLTRSPTNEQGIAHVLLPSWDPRVLNGTLNTWLQWRDNAGKTWRTPRRTLGDRDSGRITFEFPKVGR
ncbi:MAG: carboxypeptidase regulatory-like domain-containing protein [Planctomycetes bacterium]|nr:carboxypeptidase regulatory-like domain-containing protein [Planctomycetota bacterium]